MTTSDIIKKYNIAIVNQNGQDALSIRSAKKLTQKEVNEIKEAKEEIIAEIKRREAEKEAAYQAREAKIRAIEGLEEIREAIDDEEEYCRKFNKMMDDEYNDGVNPPSKPEISSGELKKKYPRAAAYLKAEEWSYASHYAKNSAGKKAKERILEGEDYEKVIAEMETEWGKHCEAHLWD